MSTYVRHGSVLRRYRLRAGLTQLRLATETGIPVSAVRQYEHGRCMPSAIREIVLMLALDIPPMILLWTR